jgi:hypothetical protein
MPTNQRGLLQQNHQELSRVAQGCIRLKGGRFSEKVVAGEGRLPVWQAQLGR